MTFCGLDIGTTCCKGVLFSEKGEALASSSYDSDLIRDGQDTYISIQKIRENVGKVLSDLSSRYSIDVIAVSSLGESFVILDKEDRVIFSPMLYTDVRGCKEAEEYAALCGYEKTLAKTGTVPNGLFSFYKLLWIKKHLPDVYANVSHILLVQDFVSYILSGERCIDLSLCSRTGMLNVNTLQLDREMLYCLELSPETFSKPVQAGTLIGNILPSFAQTYGVNPHCRIAVGAHDQVASALGAGGCQSGVGIDGMGTVECITSIFDKPVDDPRMGREGYPCIPFPGGKYCTYLLNYTGGAALHWYYDFLSYRKPLSADEFYPYFEKRIDTDKATDLLFLPYLRGAATPFQNPYAKGTIVGLTDNTAPGEIYQAILEGTSYEMKLNLETLEGHGRKINRLICTGGGSKSDKWLQIKSNILGIPVSRSDNSQGGACGCAALGALAVGYCRSLEEAIGLFSRPGKEFTPHPDATFLNQYEKYKRLYDALTYCFVKP
ncbi:MAG: hypothetical protein MJ078_02125 [Clostridia bacterium]|nr:hypothetical protein [Clostridia bacterium]